MFALYHILIVEKFRFEILRVSEIIIAYVFFRGRELLLFLLYAYDIYAEAGYTPLCE